MVTGALSAVSSFMERSVAAKSRPPALRVHSIGWYRLGKYLEVEHVSHLSSRLRFVSLASVYEEELGLSFEQVRRKSISLSVLPAFVSARLSSGRHVRFRSRP